MAVNAVAVDSLDTSAANVALADEVASAGCQDAQLGPQLTVPRQLSLDSGERATLSDFSTGQKAPWDGKLSF